MIFKILPPLDRELNFQHNFCHIFNLSVHHCSWLSFSFNEQFLQLYKGPLV